jgi:elongation of very long chain fatty acids protein 6
MRRNPWVPVAAVVLYGIGIVAGQRYMADKPRFHWRYTLAAWNLFLSVFSFMGMIRTLPVILHYAPAQSLRDNVCGDPTAPYGLGSTGLWAQLFTLSKFP